MDADRNTIIRIIDANFNRAREGLRVVEEYCRFALDSHTFASELKEIRHSLTALLESTCPHEELCTCRDISGDVGKNLTAALEKDRDSIGAVVASNFRRTAEALRAIEEYGKRLDAAFGARVEKLRYEIYDVEKSLSACLRPHALLDAARLYVLLSSELAATDVLDAAKELVDAGVDMIQLREKAMPDAELLELANKVRRITLGRCLFIMNDRVDLCLLSGADGVHLGQNDLPPGEARKILGTTKIIGVSTHSIEQARAAEAAGADYLGVGPVFATSTKQHAAPAGLEYVEAAAREATIPFFAIGAVNRDTLGQVLDSGAERVAVCTGIIAQPDIAAAVGAFRNMLTPKVKAGERTNG